MTDEEYYRMRRRMRRRRRIKPRGSVIGACVLWAIVILWLVFLLWPKAAAESNAMSMHLPESL